MDRAITFDDIKNTNQLITSFHYIKKGYIVRPHWHDFYELEILLSGKAKHILNGQIHSLNVGDAFIMTQNDFHSIEMLTDVVFFNISFNSSAISESIVKVISTGKGAFSGTIPCEILTVLNKSEALDFDNQPFAEIIKKNTTELLITEILKTYDTAQNAFPYAVNESIRFINSQFRNNISLDMLAKNLYLSPNYLGAVFKDSLGCSFRQYLNRIRLRYACSLLSGSDYSVKEIASMSGYNSKEYFIYAFKAAFGISPAKWRKQTFEHLM